jgi:hypothetical protein
MTHDELLAKIVYYPDTIVFGEYYRALRAVVELHKPYESKNYGLLCKYCDEGPSYPCGTILAIQKELQ